MGKRKDWLTKKKEGVSEHINISLYVPTRLQHYYSFVPYIFLYIY